MADRVCCFGVEFKAQPARETHAAQQSQWVLFEALDRVADGSNHPVHKVSLAAERVVDGAPSRVERHRVDGEIATRQVVGQVAAKGDLGLARARLVGFDAIRGDLDLQAAKNAADRSEPFADLEDHSARVA